MRPALLLIDLQNDFLRPALHPPSRTVVRNAAGLLRAFRQRDWPVIHIHTVVRKDGTDRMPHWKQADRWACVEGTDGVEPPPALVPTQGEWVLTKRFYSAFGNADLTPTLVEQGVDTLAVAGVYTHGCVRASVIDGYQAGFRVWLAEDAVASYDPLHARMTCAHLDGRACQLMSSSQIMERVTGGKRDAVKGGRGDILPVGWIDGGWRPGRQRRCVERYNPADWAECLATVPIGTVGDVTAACDAAARQQPRWAAVAADDRVHLLNAWARAIDRRRDELERLLTQEVGKPMADAAGEVDYALALLQSAARTCAEGDSEASSRDGVRVRHCPLGVVGIITPWNNPLALSVGKIAPALAWGNGVVWKPAIESPRVAMILVETLAEAGLPAGCVNMVFGEAGTAQAIVGEGQVAAVSFTGSSFAGRQVAVNCAMANKPFQGELGGNNAAIVTAACDVEEAAAELAAAAFSFAGQRCTAVRRMIVVDEVAERFTAALRSAVGNLRIGPPGEAATQVGPLVGRPEQERIGDIVADAVEQGGRVLCGGRVPPGLEHGCWYEPTVLTDVGQDAPVVQEESFGPVVVLSSARDLDAAIHLANDVEQGLVATLYSEKAREHAQFLAAAHAGILRINAAQASISPDAPFAGWKGSSIGPPEHGHWDRQFYTRVQSVYER